MDVHTKSELVFENHCGVIFRNCNYREPVQKAHRVIRSVTASFGNLLPDLWPQVSTWKAGERIEVAQCLRALNAWRFAFFEPNYGALEALEHHTDGDDPPDVVAKFIGGQCAMEHSKIEPEHRKEADAIQEKMWQQSKSKGEPMTFSRVVPASTIPAKGQLLNEMFAMRNHPWTSFEDEAEALMKILVRRAKEKIMSARCPSVIVLQGGLIRPIIDIQWTWFIDALKRACYEISKIPDWQKHVVITLYETVFEEGGISLSTILDPDRGFSWGFADSGMQAQQITLPQGLNG